MVEDEVPKEPPDMKTSLAKPQHRQPEALFRSEDNTGVPEIAHRCEHMPEEFARSQPRYRPGKQVRLSTGRKSEGKGVEPVRQHHESAYGAELGEIS